MNFDVGDVFASYRREGLLFFAETPDGVIEMIKALV
jgi:hypothetical protein